MRRLLTTFLLLVCTSASAQQLPGTDLWEPMGKPSSDMVKGIHKFLDRETAASAQKRKTLWPTTKNPAELAKINDSKRERLSKKLGLVETRSQPSIRSAMKLEVTQVGGLYGVRIRSVAWRVFEDAEMYGLLFEPISTNGSAAEIQGNVVVLEDADYDPEFLPMGTQANPEISHRLAATGFRVLVPTMIDRGIGWAGDAKVRNTNVSHREWLYRMAFETGRHPIGYEVESVRAAIDWFQTLKPETKTIGVVGHGEGARVALYAAALDPRISAAWVGGNFGPREATWSEPIDQNIFGLLEEFGDAEVAALVHPRSLLIEKYSRADIHKNPLTPGMANHAAPGTLKPISNESTDGEVATLQQILGGADPQFTVVGDSSDPQNLGGIPLEAFVKKLDSKLSAATLNFKFKYNYSPYHSSREHKRQLEQWVNHTQALIRQSESRRYAKWAPVKTTSLVDYEQSTAPYREEFWTNLIGKLPPALEPLKVKSKQVMDEPKFTGYAVEIPVYPDVVATGVLLLPKDLQPGEHRPVIVCQHGLEGTPEPIVNPREKSVYNSYGAQLADRGYIVYAPQNPYIGNEDFRSLQRKAQPLGQTLFAIIVRQHERTLEWLKTQPNVDPKRIAFYGLSYGGKTAMRVPAILTDYCLSICSADFNEWVVKCTNIDRPYSYMYTLEHDMYEWALADGFNYAEMAALIAPRPFMVERGHKDRVAPDEWVGYEYAKVRRLYSSLGIPERTEIGYFPDGHQIDGKATFAFLAKHLNWPRGVK